MLSQKKTGIETTRCSSVAVERPYSTWINWLWHVSLRTWRIYSRWTEWPTSCCPSAWSWFHSRACWARPITPCLLLMAGSLFTYSGNSISTSFQTTATTHPQTGEHVFLKQYFFKWLVCYVLEQDINFFGRKGSKDAWWENFPEFNLQNIGRQTAPLESTAR